MDLKSKIILISGPTASGKSSFALKLAKKINGEIINADSMQVYKQLNILTARPKKKELKKIKHHLYGFCDVKKKYSTGKWIKLLLKKITDIRNKKKIKTVGDLKNIVNSALRSTDKTIMIGIYNNQNQKRYIGVKLD